MITCPLCLRALGESVDVHHLIPVAFRGKVTVALHEVCHRAIHATFSERELLNYYHTIDRLLEHEKILSFVKWINKKPIDYYIKCQETKERRSKRI